MYNPQLETFIRVVDAGSFDKAAEQSFITPTLSHIMEIYFSEPDEDNVSDDIAEALMKNVIHNLRAAIRNPEDGKSDEETARAGVEALADFIREIGLPTTLRELGIDETVDLKEIADSCAIVPGSYKKMTHYIRKTSGGVD